MTLSMATTVMMHCLEASDVISFMDRMAMTISAEDLVTTFWEEVQVPIFLLFLLAMT